MPIYLQNYNNFCILIFCLFNFLCLKGMSWIVVASGIMMHYMVILFPVSTRDKISYFKSYSTSFYRVLISSSGLKIICISYLMSDFRIIWKWVKNLCVDKYNSELNQIKSNASFRRLHYRSVSWKLKNT